jgi:hypothetical protein
MDPADFKPTDLKPADAVPAVVEYVLELAVTWSNWNGAQVEMNGNSFTPHKVMRRVGDHITDHLAEAMARINGVPPLVDRWHHSANTTFADLAPYTANDLNEATERLRRLAQMWQITFGGLSDERLDAVEEGSMSLRELAYHTAESIDYANALGDLHAWRVY